MAIAFAAQHPQRVTHLVLWHAFPSYSEYFQSSIGDALSLVKDNWDLFTLTAAHVRVGWLRPTEARQAANLLRDSVERDFYLREIDGASELDATAFLQDVAAPTLVLCRRQFNDYELETSKRLAASIPGAKLALVSGAFNRIYDEKEEAIQQVEEFLGVSHCRPVRLQETATGQLNDLTRREIEILRYLAEGWRNREIAAKLGLSVYTVSRHVATIYQKIGAHGRAEATRYAIGFGLIPVEDPAI
jgi:DNA-binding CsgD family transcriptional regulator